MNSFLVAYGLLLAHNLLAWDNGLVFEGHRFGRKRKIPGTRRRG
jgi:hypothetical protein